MGTVIDWIRTRLGLERRATYSLRDPALVALFGGNESESGVVVTEQTALNYAAVWGAVRVISEGIASLPLHLYRRESNGRKRATDHPLYTVLHSMPCPNIPALCWRETIQAHALTHGNGYAEIERNSAGVPANLWILPPNMVYPAMAETGEVVYEYRHPQLGNHTLDSRNVFHIRGLSFDGLVGYSPVHQARESLGLGMAAQTFGARLFGSGARPSGVLEHPGTLSDDAAKRLRNDFERIHSGLSNSHRVAVLEEGMKWQSLGFPPDEAQFLQTREYQVQEVARWFNLPLSKLRVPGSGYASIEAENLVFISETLRPWLIRWEQEISAKLLMPWERSNYYAEFLVDAILRADQATRYNSYAVGRNWGWLSVNEIRALENLEPIPGGEVFLQPLNMQPLNAPMGPSAPSSTPALGSGEALPPAQPEPGAGGSNAIQENDFDAAAHELAQQMTAHEIDRCPHNATNSCRICGIKKERYLEPGEEGPPVWKFRWVAKGSRAVAAKYDHIDFSPPQGVRDEAEKGLAWREEYGRGGTEVGVARARDLSNGRNVSPDTAKRMYSYFARHESDKKGQGWSPGQDGFPSAGRIAWALWGGDAGEAWAGKLVRQMMAADNDE